MANTMAPIMYIVLLIVITSSSVAASPIRVYGVTNGAIRLPCSLNGTEGSHVYWYSNDYLSFDRTIKRTVPADIASRIAVTGVGFDYDLVISPLWMNDSRIYNCHIYNGSSQYLSTIDYELVVQSPPDEHYPECDHQISRLGSEGDVVTMSCVSRGGSPPAQLSWYRGDELLVSHQDGSENIATFSKALTVDDNGVEFTCRAVSSALVVPRQCSVSPLWIPPSVTLNASQTRVLEDNDVTYSCLGDGMPSVSYRWFVNDAAIAHGSAKYVLYDGGRGLHLVSASMSDNGTVIACQAVTPSGLASTGRRMLFVTKRTDSSSNNNNNNFGSDEPLVQSTSNMPMLLIIVAFLGGVGLTLLVTLVISLAWRRRRRRRDLRAQHSTELWSKRTEYAPAAEPPNNHDIFTKDSVFVTSSNGGHEPSRPALGPPTTQVQKNQYFEMNSGTFSESVATFPPKSPRGDYQLKSLPSDHHHLLHLQNPPKSPRGDYQLKSLPSDHHHLLHLHDALGYENVARGSGTDLTDISQSETSEHFPPRITNATGRPPLSPTATGRPPLSPTATGRAPLSPIYMDPRVPSVPMPQQQSFSNGGAPPSQSGTRRMRYEAESNGGRNDDEHADRARRGVRVPMGPDEQPEYTEIDYLGQSPALSNTYEASIISRFDL